MQNKNKINERLIMVLRKMDEVLKRNSIYEFQNQINKILKFFISIQRELQGSVSNFNFSDSKLESSVNSNQQKSKFFEKDAKQIKEKTQTEEKIEILDQISPIKTKKNTNILNDFEIENFNLYSSYKKQPKSELMIPELREILNLLEQEIKNFSNKNLYAKKPENIRNLTQQKIPMENMQKKFSSFCLSLEEDSAENKKDSDFLSISPKKNENKKNQKKEKQSKFQQNDSDEICSSFINSQDLLDKITHIEMILRNYLKDSHSFFKTKSIDDFIENSDSSKNILNEIPEFDKIQNKLLDSGNLKYNFNRDLIFNSENKFSGITNNFNNSNYSIPSIFKNFFEEKDNKNSKDKNFSSVNLNLVKENRFNFSNINAENKPKSNMKVSNFKNFLDQKNENTISDFGDTGISNFSIDNETKTKIENFAQKTKTQISNFNPNPRRQLIKRTSSLLSERLSIKENNEEFDDIQDEERMDLD